jgi:phosphotransferase system, enzyme I, PtsP
MEYAQLLLDIEDLNHLFRESVSLSTLLGKTVQLVGAHFRADVCSIYIYDDEAEELTLTATHGLSQSSVGSVKLRLGEGLVGTVLQEAHTICENDVSHDPRYRFFPGIKEEEFDAFLAAPITRGVARIGVLVLQRERSRPFAENDASAVKIVASQLANIIENAKFLMAVHTAQDQRREPLENQHKTVVRGKAASTGFACGKAVIVDKQHALDTLFKRKFDKQYTIADFDIAVKATEEQLEELQRKVEERLSDVASLIFAAHLVMLKDRSFIGEMRRLIAGSVNPPHAVLQVARKYIDIFAKSSQVYVREKVQDISDLVIRLVRNLVADSHEAWAYRDNIVIAQNLFPSDLLAMSSEGVLGVVMIGGGVTSHVAILSQSLQIPFVIVSSNELLSAPEGSTVLIDAVQGIVMVNPGAEAIEKFESSRRTGEILAKENASAMAPVTETRDGTRIHLLANINLLNDARQADIIGAEGIGLYRTEFPFLVRSAFPTEDEQLAVYKKLITLMPGKPICFRTLDIGGDKILAYYPEGREGNPMLGLRSIRFCLENVDVFKQQLRAMLRAAAGADVGIMFPMVSSLEEFASAKSLVLECIHELAVAGIEHNPKPRIGMMVEVPSVMGIIDELAAEADFFSLGTNDFIQYMLAVDRTNERVAKLYLPSHPSVLRAIKRILEAGTDKGIDVTICGDLAHDTRYLPFLIGAGFRKLSVGPAYLTTIQRAISTIELESATSLAAAMLTQSNAADAEAILDSYHSNPE